MVRLKGKDKTMNLDDLGYIELDLKEKKDKGEVLCDLDSQTGCFLCALSTSKYNQNVVDC